MKAGSMGAGAAFGIAAAGAIVSTVLAYVGAKMDFGFVVKLVLYLAVLVGTGWAATYLTQASTGKGILASLVGGVLLAIGTYFAVKAGAADALAKAQADIASSANGATKDAALNASLNSLGQGMMSAAVTAAATGAAILNLIFGFLFGMIGNFIGGAMKKSAVGTTPALARAA